MALKIVGSSPIVHPMKKHLRKQVLFQLNLPIFAKQMWANLISLSASAENFTMTAGHYFIFGASRIFHYKSQGTYFTKDQAHLMVCFLILAHWFKSRFLNHCRSINQITQLLLGSVTAKPCASSWLLQVTVLPVSASVSVYTAAGSNMSSMAINSVFGFLLLLTTFKKQFGITPGQYKKQLRADV